MSDTIAVPLHNRAGDIVAYTTIDAADEGQIQGYSWLHQKTRTVGDKGYARAMRPRGERRMVLMHRLLMGVIDSGPLVEVDHIDRNGLNNCRSNLRLATRKENCQNLGVRKDSQTGFRGVGLHGKRYRAVIMIDHKRYRLGIYDTPQEAYAEVCAFRAKLMPFSEAAMQAVIDEHNIAPMTADEARAEAIRVFDEAHKGFQYGYALARKYQLADLLPAGYMELRPKQSNGTFPASTIAAMKRTHA